MEKINFVNTSYLEQEDNMITVCIMVSEDEEMFEKIFEYKFLKDSNSIGTLNIYKELDTYKLKEIFNIVKDKPKSLNIFKMYLQTYRGKEIKSNKEILDVFKTQNQKKEFQDNRNKLDEFCQRLIMLRKNKFLRKPIVGAMAYKKTYQQENEGEFVEKYKISIIREGSSVWQDIFDYECGTYTEFDIQRSINSLREYIELGNEDVLNIFSLLTKSEELEVLDKYLKNKEKILMANEQFVYSIKGIHY